MSGQGRCAGCERTGPLKVIRAHTVSCQQFALLCQNDPARALDPADEHARWAAEDKAADRTARRDGAMAVNEARRAEQHGRFARLPDILED